MESNPAYVSTLHRKYERVKKGSYEFVHKLTIVKLYIVFSCYCNCYFQTWYVEVSDICQITQLQWPCGCGFIRSAVNSPSHTPSLEPKKLR